MVPTNKSKKERFILLQLRDQRKCSYGKLIDNIYIKVLNSNYPDRDRINEKVKLLKTNILMYPLNDIIKDKLKLNTTHSYKSFSNLKEIKIFPEDVIKMAYKR